MSGGVLEASVQGKPEVIAYLNGRVLAIQRGVLQATETTEIDMVSWIKDTKLSGDPLKRRSGNLSRAMAYERPSVVGGYVQGKVYVGKEAPYAHVHEDGGDFFVPGHMSRRRALMGGVGRSGPVLRRQFSGDGFFVRGHIAHYKQRPFMAPARANFAPIYQERVSAATGEGLKP